MIDLTCRLYIEGPESLDTLVEHVGTLTGGARTGRTISTPSLEIDLELSEDADAKQAQTADGFLYWLYGAYVEPGRQPMAEADYIALVAGLIVALLRDGWHGVASCDFEDEIARLTGWNWSELTTAHP
ncbi:hypothetical protein [Rhodovulum sulfidophilum]|nr:hypothetical protein [Rhodovulum sulfidophilum]